MTSSIDAITSVPIAEISYDALLMFRKQFEDNDDFEYESQSSQAILVISRMRKLAVDILLSMINRMSEETVVTALSDAAIQILHARAGMGVVGTGDVALLLTSENVVKLATLISKGIEENTKNEGQDGGQERTLHRSNEYRMGNTLNEEIVTPRARSTTRFSIFSSPMNTFQKVKVKPDRLPLHIPAAEATARDFHRFKSPHHALRVEEEKKKRIQSGSPRHHISHGSTYMNADPTTPKSATAAMSTTQVRASKDVINRLKRMKVYGNMKSKEYMKRNLVAQRKKDSADYDLI